MHDVDGCQDNHTKIMIYYTQGNNCADYKAVVIFSLSSREYVACVVKLLSHVRCQDIYIRQRDIEKIAYLRTVRSYIIELVSCSA